MARRPERALIALGALAALAAAGCGKSNLAETTTSATASTAATNTLAGKQAQAPAKPGTNAPGHAPSAARSTAFARAVTLTAADVPGARTAPRASPSTQREREATSCGGRTTPAVGEARSPEFQRGKGLDRESLSSSVEVLRDARTVERDLSGTPSAGGLRCYERVLERSLQKETDPNVRLLSVKVSPLHMTVDNAGTARGIRILARVGVPSAAAVVPLYVDALSVPYGPAEIDLYATSFVQPVAARTEQQLLQLLHERATHEKL
jgi:hypothetical protein